MLVISVATLVFGQWGADVRLTSDPAASGTSYSNAWCVAASGDTVHVVWTDYRLGTHKIYYKRSLDCGTTWSSDARLTDSVSDADYPSIVSAGGAVHVVWYDDRNGNSETYYKRSLDGGATWGADTRLTNDTWPTYTPSVAVSGTVVHMVTGDWRAGNEEVYYKRSVDSGTTWGADTRLTNAAGSSSYPSVAASGSTVNIAWQDSRDGNYEIYHKRSTDWGASWFADTRLTNNVNNSASPSIAASGSTVHVVWYDDRDGNYEMYYKRSTTGGASWSGDIRLTNAAGRSIFHSVAASGTTVHLVWEDERDGNQEVYYKRSTDDGFSWGSDTRLTTSADSSAWPSVAATDSAVHVVWSDKRDGNFETYYKRGYARDVSCAWLGAPSGTLDSGSVVTPVCSVYNNGPVTETYQVRMRIGAGYDRSLTVTSHAPGTMQCISFPSWTATSRGLSVVTCSTELSGDRVSTNNRASDSVTVSVKDVGCSRVAMPATVDSGAVVTPACTLYNHGTTTEDYSVRMRIGTGYADSAAVTGHAPGASVRVTFPDWIATQIGSVPVTCSTELAVDMVNANDRQTDNIYVTTDTIWVPEPSPPLGERGKAIGDGGAMASLPGEGDTTYSYLLKGNNTCEFYVYTDPGYGFKSGTGYWTTRESIPAIGRSSKKKTVKKGSALIAAEGRIYAFKGNSTNEFWCYTPSSKGRSGVLADGGWVQFDDIPGDKKCKDGTSAASVTIDGAAYVYVLKGGTNEFYRKNLSAKGAWETQTGAPLPPSGKVYKTGSAIVYYPDDKDAPAGRIFVLKGSYNEFNAFDLATSIWTPKASLPLTTPPSTKKTKAKAGAGLAYSPCPKLILALKGNKTQETWKYAAAGDAWTRGKDVPLPPSGKKVGAGGSISCIGGIVYITKGNKTTDFYSLPVSESYGGHLPLIDGETRGAQGQTSIRNSQFALSIAPNPFTHSLSPSISYSLSTPGSICLKLHDITGKLVSTLASGYHAAGAYSSRLTANSERLAAGIYVLKYEAGEYRATEKLVIE